MKVDWSQSGETIENVVAVLLRRENPMATQIRPSQGDGGIDVISPLGTGGFEIFQVKKFNASLTTSQLGKIAASYASLNKYREEHRLDVRSWHLVMPLNPTTQNLGWLSELTKGELFPSDWRGRDYLDGLAAKFPDVIDYYLQDGADRVERVVNQMVALLGIKEKTDGAGLITPAQVIEQLHGLETLLNTDPHFSYGISIAPVVPKLHEMGSGFVAALTRSTTSGEGGAVTVKIFPKFVEALRYRPIPGAVSFNVEPGSTTEDDVRRFLKYGAPLEAPEGSTNFDIDLPGGLGGSFEGAAIRIGPALGASNADGHRLRLAAVSPLGAAVAEVQMNMAVSSSGLDHTGIRSTGTDASETFDVEFLVDLSKKSFKFNLKQRDLSGRAPSEVLDAVRFLSALRSPNSLVVAQPFGPLTGERLDLSGASDWVNQDTLGNVELVLETLAAIQESTPVQIVVPPTDTINRDAVDAWLTAKQLIEGQIVELEQFEATVCMKPDAALPTGPIAIAIESDFGINIGQQTVELGKQITHASSAAVVEGSAVKHDDHVDCAFRSAPEASVTIRLVRPPT